MTTSFNQFNSCNVCISFLPIDSPNFVINALGDLVCNALFILSSCCCVNSGSTSRTSSSSLSSSMIMASLCFKCFLSRSSVVFTSSSLFSLSIFVNESTCLVVCRFSRSASLNFFVLE